MANILKQQDLLKGLPDARLVMLAQNPTGDIPLFLIAAEMNRREEIRGQYAPDANEESVVDTLTKQIARVPQNLQSSPQMPPMVPPTPPMAGVAALEQQMAMEQAAQNAVQQQEPQMMRHGGQVKRYNVGGVGFRGRQGAGAYAPGEEPPGFGIVSKVYDYVSPSLDAFLENMRIHGANMTPQDVEEAADRMRNAQGEDSDPKIKDALKEPFNYGMTGEDRRNAGKTIAPKPPESTAEPPPKEENETEDEYRARLNALYDGRGADDWTKAQRWFSMAEQFLDPSKTTMQSIAGAGRTFAEQSAAINDAELANEIEREKALLLYDREEANRRRSEAVSAAEMQRDAYKFYAEEARQKMAVADENIKSLSRERAEYVKSLPKDMMTDSPIIEKGPDGLPLDPYLRVIDEQIAEQRQFISDLAAQSAASLRGFGELTGTDPSVEVFISGSGLRRVGR